MRRALLALALLATPAHAVEPSEILDDPALETRAREISKGLRCLVCRNESIDESNAELARDLRVIVRERLVAGDTDAEVEDFVTARYGDYVLLKPRFTASTALLYLGGPLLLLLGGLAAWRVTRRTPAPAAEAPAPLTPEERAKLEALERRQG